MQDELNVLTLMHAAERVDSGRWRMQCPAHGGALGGSLEVSLEGGRYRLRCIAGCTTDAILKAALAKIEARDPLAA